MCEHPPIPCFIDTLCNINCATLCCSNMVYVDLCDTIVHSTSGKCINQELDRYYMSKYGTIFIQIDAHALIDTHPPLSPISLHTKLVTLMICPSKMHGSIINCFIFAIIMFSSDELAHRFWAHHHEPMLCLAHAQCVTIWMNTIPYAPHYEMYIYIPRGIFDIKRVPINRSISIWRWGMRLCAHPSQ